jgi:hypothetical protein
VTWYLERSVSGTCAFVEALYAYAMHPCVRVLGSGSRGQGFGVRVLGSGFGVEGGEFGVQGLGIVLWGLGSRV